ncbi:hypothetical protein C8A01DRAFT_36262 [Parachaetomium inaequale]|uniref:Uncharacterized protein n=1 Tax=Parachaetomium inaequale TaxID=2588326 RepID=A0AAN6SRL1_9PEZI|nr:hypothetical protein C8A01DRAFT_36262 [Parachaetomium inaequale]
MTLLLYILEGPEDPDAEADAELLRGFGRQVKRMQNDGDFEMSNLLKAYLGLEQLANAAISQTRNDEALEAGAEPEPSQDAFPHNVVQRFKELLTSATHPMYLAQGLLTNLPNRDIDIYQSIARILGMPLVESDPYGPLVPGCTKPGTYGFGFAARVQPRVVVDPDRFAPSSQACPRNVQPELASLVIAPEMAAQLDELEAVDTVVEECR